ncbi:glycosyltransferase [Acidovorax soli]|uniref:Rhamnosyltransferase n=1 Tax=Acidovorax soli TaxID=592050 RepID=A0A1H3YS04_9BURK|nr:glycosyltransferase [Acidovorax soli]SEA14313.1 rhamnosyltransferase [Acidovorax soli]
MRCEADRELNVLPSVAVCLAAFNGMDFLAQQLTSILQQKRVAVTIFISVDKSTDDTENWVELMAKEHSNIIILPHGEIFGGAAKNFFRLLRDVNFFAFDFIAFSDQDDIWLPEKLFRAHEVLLKIDADAYSSNVTAFWPDGSQHLIAKNQAQVQWDFLFEAAGPGCTYVMRKELVYAIQALIKTRWTDVQKVGLHDWFFYAFARSNGYRWIIDDCAGMLYRQHENNQVGVNSGFKAFFHRARKVSNGWGLAQSALISELVGLGNNPFVKRWSGGSRAGLLWLAFHAWQCRRRVRDKILFFLSCIALCLVGSRPQ